MQVLVTGGTGFLGGHLVERLVRRGDKVRVLVRPTSDLRLLRSLGVELATGDITDAASVKIAAGGADVVFHAAALASDYGPAGKFRLMNVEGTQNVIDACVDERVPRLVHVSTQSVIFAFDDHLGTDESYPIPARHRDAYSATKAEAERRVLAAHRGALFTTAIRPHIIWGPRDTTFLPRIEALARRNQLILVGDGLQQVSLSYVDNVVDALLLAAERDGAGGEAFFIVDREPVGMRRFIEGLCRAMDAPGPKGAVPYGLAFAAGTLIEGIWKLLRKETPPPISRYGVAVTGRNLVFRWEKAQRLLGYTPAIDFEEGLRRIAAWRQETARRS